MDFIDDHVGLGGGGSGDGPTVTEPQANDCTSRREDRDPLDIGIDRAAVMADAATHPGGESGMVQDGLDPQPLGEDA